MNFKQIKLNEGKLLNEDGMLNESGYSHTFIKEFNKDCIKASKLNVKSWDYYYIGNKRYAISLVIADLGYSSRVNVTLINYLDNIYTSKTIAKPLSLGKLNLETSPLIGNCSYSDKDITIKFLNDGKSRHLMCNLKKFEGEKDFSCDVILMDAPIDSINVALPFKNKNQYIYSHKTVGFKAVGKAKVGTHNFFFDDDYSLGILDWSRCVNAKGNQKFWAASCGLLDSGLPIGFNLGYGFGDNTNATENMIFCNGKGYKTEQVTFYEANEKRSHFQITSSDNLVNLTFTPLITQNEKSMISIFKNTTKIYGTFSGKVILDDEEVEIDNIHGMIETTL